MPTDSDLIASINPEAFNSVDFEKLMAGDAILPNETTMSFNGTISHQFGAAAVNIPPPHLERLPVLDIIQSEYNFEVATAQDNNQIEFKNQKLFIKMNNVVNFDVSCTPKYVNELLYVRAMIIFTKPNEMHLSVKRCANHRQTNGQPNNDHILKCCHPHAEYTGHEEGKIFRDRMAVTIQLGEVGPDGQIMESIGYEFGCQNSCSSGINRRATSIIFTLEDNRGFILGRRAIQFKVCTCPKRDADRETNDKRKKGESSAFPKGKRPKLYSTMAQSTDREVKQEPDDSDQEMPSPTACNLNLGQPTSCIQLVLPTELVPEVLGSVFNVVAGRMALDGRTIDEALYTKVLKDVKTYMKNDHK